MPVSESLDQLEPVELPDVLLPGLFDPAPELVALREQRPLCRLRFPDGQLGWLVTSHALAREILADPRFSILPPRFAVDDGGFSAAVARVSNPGDLLRLDPPEHTRVRRSLTAFFTVKRVAERRPSVERIVADCLDAMEDAGPPVDLVKEFAEPIPAMTICDLMGVPSVDAETFVHYSKLLGTATTSPDEKMGAIDEFYAYVREVLAEKRSRPGDDLLSELIAASELNEDELAGVAWFLFAAGTETTSSAFSLSVFLLLSDRDRWEALRRHPSIERAVEELLRYMPLAPGGLPARTALEDVEFGATTIRAGEPVAVLITVPNRDPTRFGDPDRFDPERDASGHLLFGHGRHMCLGQHLARLELQVGLEGLMRRFPTLRLAVPVEEVPFCRHGSNAGLVERLPVTW